jgi:hypothetical protein
MQHSTSGREFSPQRAKIANGLDERRYCKSLPRNSCHPDWTTVNRLTTSHQSAQFTDNATLRALHRSTQLHRDSWEGPLAQILVRVRFQPRKAFETYAARQTKAMVVRTNAKKIHWLATIQTSPPNFRITHVLFATSLAIKIMSIIAAGFGFRKSRIATNGSSNVSDVQKITVPIGMPP